MKSGIHCEVSQPIHCGKYTPTASARFNSTSASHVESDYTMKAHTLCDSNLETCGVKEERIASAVYSISSEHIGH
jgi:hypothetical protein